MFNFHQKSTIVGWVSLGVVVVQAILTGQLSVDSLQAALVGVGLIVVDA